MNHINNDTDHILIRKTRNILIVVGTGTIMFSVWTVVKTLSSIFLLRDEAIAAARKTVDEIGLVVPDQQLFFIALVAKTSVSITSPSPKFTYLLHFKYIQFILKNAVCIITLFHLNYSNTQLQHIDNIIPCPTH